MKSSKHTKAQIMMYISMCVCLMAVCSWIAIPFPIPFTLQLFAVFFTLLFLGGLRGTIAIIVYLLLGAIGLPVFSYFTGGPGHFFSPTGGYLIGFVLIGVIYIIFEKLFSACRYRDIPALIIGLIVCYGFGTFFYAINYAHSENAMSIYSILAVCVLPYIIPDLIKLFLALYLSKILKRLL